MDFKRLAAIDIGTNSVRSIMVAAVTVVDQVMKVFEINKLKISEHGIREGLILEMIAGSSGSRSKLMLRKSALVNRKESVLAFAESCRRRECSKRFFRRN